MANICQRRVTVVGIKSRRKDVCDSVLSESLCSAKEALVIPYSTLKPSVVFDARVIPYYAKAARPVIIIHWVIYRFDLRSPIQRSEQHERSCKLKNIVVLTHKAVQRLWVCS